MSGALIAGALWVIASTIVALMPMERQYKPGVVLLLLGPVLMIWIGYSHGWIWTALAGLAFVSLYRNPLRYFWRRFFETPDQAKPAEIMGRQADARSEGESE